MHDMRTTANDNPKAWCVSQPVCQFVRQAPALLHKRLNGSRSCLGCWVGVPILLRWGDKVGGILPIVQYTNRVAR